MHINTKCVQSGYEPKNGEPRVVPIAQSTTFKYDTAGNMGDLFDLKANGFFYTRLANPTVDAVENIPVPAPHILIFVSDPKLP